jgi:tetratricopeptide (TPR) repeat protein
VHQEKRSAWPVVDNDGLLGMLPAAKLDEALEGGRGWETVGALVASPGPQARLTAENFPHVHADHTLDLAMRRMAQTGLTTLPVVSRSNVREMTGLISLEDILAAYGLEKSGAAAEAARPDPADAIVSPRGLLIVFVVALLLIGVLSYAYQTSRTARVQQHFELGQQFVQQQRYQEAIAEFRNALSISHGARERLALAEALEKAGAKAEAEIYFREVLRANPDSGPAHLGLAHIISSPQNIPEYRRAISGSWTGDAARQRIEARAELIKALRQSGDTAQTEKEMEKQRQAWEDLVHQRPSDAFAWAGLGEADLALNDPAGALKGFREAVRLDSENQMYRKRLQLVEQVMALDPVVGGLTVGERYRRSRKLMEAALGALDQCLAGKSGPVADELRDVADEARKILLQHGLPNSYLESTRKNVELARQLWGERLKFCGQPGAAEDALSRAMAAVGRSGASQTSP